VFNVIIKDNKCAIGC